MASAHATQYPYSVPPPPPNMRNDHVRLPSIGELGFGQDGAAPPTGGGQPDHARLARPEWPRSAPSGPGPALQYATNAPPPHDSTKSQYSPRGETQYTSPALPAHTQQSASAPGPNGSTSSVSRSDAPAPNALKRPRSGSGVGASASPGRSHNPYPQHAPYASQPPPPGFQPGPVPLASPHEPAHHHPPPVYTHPPPGYPTYAPPPPHLTRHYPVAPPIPVPIHHHHAPNAPYPPPPVPAEHWSHPPHQAPPHHYAPFPPRNPALPPPPPVDARGAVPAENEKVVMRQNTLQEIYKHCIALQQFASRYSHIQATSPNVQPPPEELEDMARRASAVVRLLEDLRRLGAVEEAGSRDSTSAPVNTAEEPARPPKRPWEDVSREEENVPPPPQNAYPEQAQAPYPDIADKSTAEADMEIIRSKRATSTSGTAPGQPKSKYRKRSRATPPGKCHSCNIRETPEWRRGPDGARTLCNACGLHYAKLMRKRDKGADGKAAPIDLQTLRASTQSSRGAESETSQSQQPQSQQPPLHQQGPPMAQGQYDQSKQAPPPPMHANHHPGHPPAPHPHTGPYQLLPVPQGPPPAHQMMPPPPPPQQPHSEHSIVVPPPPWMTSPTTRSGYSDQSYMRSSHPPSHARASPQ